MPASEHCLETGMSFGRYQVASRLAVGGMATVWRARMKGAEGFEKDVVIKTMLPRHSSSSELSWMFVNEATIAARLNHPNIVQVFDFGCLAGHHYMVMELLAGQSLRQIERGLRSNGEPFPRRVLLRAISDVCNALGYAHDLNDESGWLEFVHGDLSPDNVIVSHGGVSKLIDFGAAHIKSSPRLSGQCFIGKYRYTSPEILGGSVGDRRSDIYALGVMLYELLTGVRPYDGDDLEIIRQIRRGQPRHPLELAPDLSPDLVDMTLTAMAADPEDRYQTVAQLADQIGQCLHEPAEPPEPPARVIDGALPRLPRGDDAARLVEICLDEAVANDESDAIPRGDGVPCDVQSKSREATGHFDRGFALVAAKRYQEAMQEWQLALAGDPGNRIYQTNVRRLRVHVKPTALDDQRG